MWVWTGWSWSKFFLPRPGSCWLGAIPAWKALLLAVECLALSHAQSRENRDNVCLLRLLACCGDFHQQSGAALKLTVILFSSLLRKDQNLLSPVNCWYLLLNQVRRESKDHATLSDIYLNNVIMRFMQISEDSTRMFKKVCAIIPSRVCLPVTTCP